MSQLGQPYTSGRWVVKEGKEEAFIQEWTAFTEWSRAAARGAESFFLIQDRTNGRHFLSFGGWSDPDAVQAWRSTSEMGERLGRCRALCDEFQAGDYVLSALVG